MATFLSRVLSGIANPLSAVKGIVSGIVKGGSGKEYQKSLAKTEEFAKQKPIVQVGKAALTLGVAEAVAVGSVLAAPVIATSVAKAGGVSAIAGKTAATIIKNPLKAVKTAAGSILGTAALVGVVKGGGLSLIEPTISGVAKSTQVATEVVTGQRSLSSDTLSDVIKGAGIVAGVGTVGAIAAVGIEKLIEKGKEEKVINTLENTPEASYLGGVQTLPEKVIYSDEGQPLTRATSTISTTRRKRSKKKISNQIMQQKVNVVVSNIANKRYLNKMIYN